MGNNTIKGIDCIHNTGTGKGVCDDCYQNVIDAAAKEKKNGPITVTVVIEDCSRCRHYNCYHNRNLFYCGHPETGEIRLTIKDYEIIPDRCPLKNGSPY